MVLSPRQLGHHSKCTEQCSSWRHCCRSMILCPCFLVPRLRPGIDAVLAPPEKSFCFTIIVEAEPPVHAFPGRAWKRENPIIPTRV
jgi:hypothetical protein